MSTFFHEIISVLQIRCTGQYEIDMIWIDYIYLENHTAVVSDAHTHGIVVEYPKDVTLQRSERYKVKLIAKHLSQNKYPFQFIITSMTPIPSSDERLCCGPSYAVILNQSGSSSSIPHDRPYTHSSSILMMQGISSPYYIALKYMLKHVFTAMVTSSREALWKDIFEYSFLHGPTFRYIELESIGAWNFIHDHDWPCNKIPKQIDDETDRRNVERLREIATAELDRRYASGELDRDPKVDLPSGKCDVVEASNGGFRFEGPFEACIREVREETGIDLAQLVFEGFSLSESQELHVRSRFYFFSIRPKASLRIGKQDCYIASSWTLPAHIRGYMKAVEGSAMKRGRFDSLRRVGDADVIFSAVSVIQHAPEDSDWNLWEAVTGQPAHGVVTRGAGRESAQSNGWKRAPKASAGVPPASDAAKDRPAAPQTTLKSAGDPKADAALPNDLRPALQPSTAQKPSRETSASSQPQEIKDRDPHLLGAKKSTDIIVEDGGQDDAFDDSFLQSFSRLSTGDRGGARGRGRGRGRG